MALPKRRHSKARRDKRRSHDAMPLPNYAYCPRCNAVLQPHRVCAQCGYYRNKLVIQVKQKEKKKKA